MAITWQSLNGPSMMDAARISDSGGNLISKAFTGVDDIFKRREKAALDTWEQGRLANTNSFLNAVQEPTSVEDFQAKKAALVAMMSSKGEQIDSTAARSALDGRLSTLQQRFTADGAYQDEVQKPLRDQIIAANLSGDALTRNIMMQDPALRNKASLLQNFDARAQDELARTRAATEFDWKGAAEKDRAAMAPVERRVKEAAIRASNAQATASGEASKLAVFNKTLAQQKNDTEMLAEVNKSTELAQKNPYAQSIDYGPKSKLFGEFDTMFGGDKGQGAAILEKMGGGGFTIPVYKDGKVVGSKPVEVPLAILQKAALIESESLTDEATPQWRVADNVKKKVQALLNDDNEVRNIAQAQLDLGKAKDTSKGGGSETTKPPLAPADAAKAIRDGAFAATPPPESNPLIPDALNPNMKKPVLNNSGSLEFSANGMSFGTERGVIPPKDVPMGKMTTKVLDGDTLEITGENGKTMKIRIGEGDAGEIAHRNREAQAGGKESTEYLMNSLMNSGNTQLVFTDNNTDKNGRYIARLLVNRQDFSKAAMRDGMMIPLDMGNSSGAKAENKALHMDAILNNRGIYNNRDPRNVLTPALARATGQSRY